ncbi:MAG: hypothetical protein C5B49_01960, partial [Bdellovibrio sp.]
GGEASDKAASGGGARTGTDLGSACNRPPGRGDAVVESLETIEGLYPNPYRGQAMSCAGCHLVDQAKSIAGFGVRAYTDGSHRSRIPERGDGLDRTVRNSPNMVAMALRDGLFLHHDGEFVRPEDLVRASYLGRNMGWLADEELKALHHIAEVVRHDSGAYPTDTDLGGLTYKELLSGKNTVPAKFRIPAKFRMDIDKANDSEIFEAVIHLVGQYLRALDYSRDAKGDYNGTPYDLFLQKNGLPRSPDPGESEVSYSKRLYNLVVNSTRGGSAAHADHLSLVDAREGQFKLHKQDFVFSENELAGFKTFFGSGQCIQCHSAPDFTDHLFHNTGVSQFEYDQVHGSGSFAKLHVPHLAERNSQADLYLPPTFEHPNAKSIFRSIPDTSEPLRADLGAWVVFRNPAMPTPQTLLKKAICQSLNWNCNEVTDDKILDGSLAMIKTPAVRDLGQSAPYFHSGHAGTLEEVIRFYETYSALAREGVVRNADPRLKDIQLGESDGKNLVLFLKSLNEDYN